MLPEGSKLTTPKSNSNSSSTEMQPTTSTAGSNSTGAFRVKRVAEINGNVRTIQLSNNKSVEEDTASTSKRRRTNSSETSVEFIVINGTDAEAEYEENADGALTIYLHDEPLDIKSEVESDSDEGDAEPRPSGTNDSQVNTATAVIKVERDDISSTSTSADLNKNEVSSKALPKGYVKPLQVKRLQHIHTLHKQSSSADYVPLPCEFYVGESFGNSSGSSMAAAQKRMLAKLHNDNNKETTTESPAPSATQHIKTEKCTTCNLDVMQEVLKKLNSIEATVNKLEQKIDLLSKDVVSKKDFSLQNKIIRDNLLITKRLGLTTQRVFGNTQTEVDVYVAARLPLNTIDEFRELEEKLEEEEYMSALKLHLFTLKGTTGNVDTLFRKVIGDQCVANFNWDGRYRRMALQATKLFSTAFIDTFPDMTRVEVEKSIRKSVERAHNRLKQFKFKYRKATLLNTEGYNKAEG